MATSLQRRLLQDIAELKEKPYPNIKLHVQEGIFTTACLILSVAEYKQDMHLTVEFPDNYPLRAPRIRMDSNVSHPNIFGDYICASILNTEEGYTSAYTLKGIAIQLLSFFTAEKVEQDHGMYSVNLNKYRERQRIDSFTCQRCGHRPTSTTAVAAPSTGILPILPSVPPNVTNSISKSKSVNKSAGDQNSGSAKIKFGLIQRKAIPDEVLLLICEQLDTEEVLIFAEAWNRIGRLVTDWDIIRTRELQCFCLKSDHTITKLGVGVNITGRGRFGFLESEFDLLSQEGFSTHRIRRSVQGVAFAHWLPLPISNGHWRKIKDDVSTALSAIGTAAHMDNATNMQVIFRFMNDVVVKLNNSETAPPRPGLYSYYGMGERESAKSTLTHASEKAIESYFHLFHLLICLATAQPGIVKAANRMLENFKGAGISKEGCPDLGHLLIAALISEVPMTEQLMKSIIKEAVTRNVVWMLGDHPELSYLEPSEVSNYRLKTTFEASKVSYRLLMFLNLFRRTAVGSPREPLDKLRDQAFERHGAPPRGSAKGLATAIKNIQTVNNFPDFLRKMDITPPPASWFTEFLRECVKSSMAKGYSKMPISQAQALTLRLGKEPGVAVEQGFCAAQLGNELRGHKPFFPGFPAGARGGGNQRGGGRGGRGGRAGRGGY